MSPQPQPATPSQTAVDAFIDRWSDTGGKERANYQLFLTELCQLLDLPGPDPATQKDEDDAYVFERRVDIRRTDGNETRGYIDLYRRGHYEIGRRLNAHLRWQDLAPTAYMFEMQTLLIQSKVNLGPPSPSYQITRNRVHPLCGTFSRSCRDILNRNPTTTFQLLYERL